MKHYQCDPDKCTLSASGQLLLFLICYSSSRAVNFVAHSTVILDTGSDCYSDQLFIKKFGASKITCDVTYETFAYNYPATGLHKGIREFEKCCLDPLLPRDLPRQSESDDLHSYVSQDVEIFRANNLSTATTSRPFPVSLLTTTGFLQS